jgi:DNA-binding response OmpR family regulator
MISYANSPITSRRDDSDTRRLAVELIAQLLGAGKSAGMRRENQHAAGEADLLFRFGDFTLDPRFRKVLRGGVPVTLALREYELLVALAQRCGEPVSKDMLREEVWMNRIDPQSRSIDQHVAELRKKLRVTGSESPIVTVRKYGYALSGEWVPRLRAIN